MKSNINHKAKRVRAKGKAVSNRPRLSVVRSLRYLSAQVINDRDGVTVAAVHEKKFMDQKDRTKRFQAMAKELAAKTLKNKIKQVWLDRGRLSYHGRVAAFADELRSAGLEF